LTGCPTGAIGRYHDGQIDINPQTCIGCGDCATQCPYNAITLVPKVTGRKRARYASLRAQLWAATRRLLAWLWRWGRWLIEQISFRPPQPPPEINIADAPPLVAIKCNLCRNTSLNRNAADSPRYSCEENCPTGALLRVNPLNYFAEAGHAIGTIYHTQTTAIGRNIHQQDQIAQRWHTGGQVATGAVTALTVAAIWYYGLDAHLAGTSWTMRWLTGVGGLLTLL